MITLADIHSSISIFTTEHPLLASALTSVVTSGVLTGALVGLVEEVSFGRSF